MGHIKNDNRYNSAYEMQYITKRSIFFYCDPREMAQTLTWNTSVSDTGVPLADLTAPN